MSDLFLQGVNLAMYGMGTVFVFLTMLVGVTMLMSKLCGEAPAELSSITPAATPTTVSADPHLLAAISAAVSAYRRNRE